MTNERSQQVSEDRAKRLERAWFRLADRLNRHVSPRLLPALARWLQQGSGWLPLPNIWRLRAIVYCHHLLLPDTELGPLLATYERDEVQRAFGHDPWYCNRFLNLWEYERGATVLETYPCDISLPIADVCNARCTFCTSWLEGTRMLGLSELDAFEPVLRHAHVVGLAGHGEPLSHPELPSILDRLSKWIDFRGAAYVITNGVYLDRYIVRLIAARVRSYAISLNAVTGSTHETVMGLPTGSFDLILAAVRRLVAIRDEPGKVPRLHVSISLVLTKQNMHEVADFVRLGNELNVDEIQLKTLAGVHGRIVGLNYHDLPPYDHPDYKHHKAEALAAIAESRVPVKADAASWDTRIFPADVEAEFIAKPPLATPRSEAMADREVRAHYAAQEKFNTPTRGAMIEEIDDRDGDNPYSRMPRFNCRAPYYFLYINDFSYNMSPCCYMGRVPGHESTIYDGSYDFFEAWNSPAMVGLRARLRDGPLFRMCERCPGVY